MNSFFFKNLISSNSNRQNQEQEQSDFQRLIELCNSYGLNEQQTNQLISEFKKGSYRSNSNSLNQSMVSEQQDISMSQNNDQSQQNYHHQQSLQPSRTSYQQPQYYHENQSSNRYYGYGNEMEEKDEDSYNEMTFNEQNNSLLMNSQRYHQGNHQQFDPQLVNGQSFKQQILFQQQQKISERTFDERPLERNNSKKQTLIQKRNSPQQSLQITNHQKNINDSTKNVRDSISTKTVSQQVEKTSAYEYSIQQKTSQQSSKISQNSMQQHSIDNEPENGLNPEYVKALIRNFELLEGENEALKQERSDLQRKNEQLIKQNDLVKKENERLKKEIEQIKSKDKMSINESLKFETLLQSEKQKNQMLLGMKEKDTEVIRGLKDSLMQLTELIKQKDTQNNELQQRLFSIYEKLQNQNSSNSSQYLVNQNNGGNFQQTGESISTGFGKSYSKKSLNISQSEKSLKKDVLEDLRERERRSNYGRKDLGEIMGNNINLLPNNQLNNQQGKQMVREQSASRLNSCSNEQTNFKKPSSNSLQATRESKQNVFTPLEVQPAHRRSQNSKPSEEDAKKRPSSRVDIKKYKGMIEELRNSYSNVGNGNGIMR